MTMTALLAPKPSDPRLLDNEKKALDAITEIVRDILASPLRSRFSEAQRYCQIAQTIIRARSSRAEDFDGDDDIGGVGYRGPRMAAPFVGDQTQILRDVMMTIAPQFASMAEQQKSAAARNELQELDTLLEMRDRFAIDAPERATLDSRVQRLMKNIEARNADPEPEQPKPHVVSPDVPRGHSPGGGGPEDDEPSSVRPDADGAHGDGDPPKARVEVGDDF